VRHCRPSDAIDLKSPISRRAARSYASLSGDLFVRPPRPTPGALAAVFSLNPSPKTSMGFLDLPPTLKATPHQH
jgi:hypothetical protein